MSQNVWHAKIPPIIALWPWEPSIDQNLHPFTSNGDVSIWANDSLDGPKKPDKRAYKENVKICLKITSVLKA